MDAKQAKPLMEMTRPELVAHVRALKMRPAEQRFDEAYEAAMAELSRPERVQEREAREAREAREDSLPYYISKGSAEQGTAGVVNDMLRYARSAKNA